MPTDVNPIAEPSAALQYDSWDDKGTPIVSKKAEAQPSQQDSAPVDDQKQTDKEPVKAAESGTAKAQESKDDKGDDKGGKLDANARIRQLNAVNKALEERLRTLEAAPQPPAKTEPIKAETKPAPKLPERPKRPTMADYDGTAGKTLKEYEDAMDKYTEDLSTWTAAKAVSDERQRQADFAQTERVNSQLGEARKNYEDFDTVAAPIVKQFQENTEIHPAVRAALSNSPILPHLMYALGGDQSRLTTLVTLSKSDPIEAVKRLGAIEAIVMEELKKGKAQVVTEQARDENGKFVTDKKETPEDPKPRAPKPPSEVGGRGTPGEDALVEAARAGRFPDFEAEQWRRVKASRQQA